MNPEFLGFAAAALVVIAIGSSGGGGSHNLKQPQQRSGNFDQAVQASSDYATGKISHKQMLSEYQEAGCKPIAPPMLTNPNIYGPIRPSTINYGADCTP